MVISVSGPSFAGKTYLVANLVKEFPDLKVVNFEKHVSKKNRASVGYGNFYEDIDSLIASDKGVICESVYPPETNPYNKHQFDNMLNVVCLPDRDKHYNNYKHFLKLHGWEAVKKRTCGASINHFRDEYAKHIPPNHVKCDGKNYKEVIEKIRRWLQCGLSHQCTSV